MDHTSIDRVRNILQACSNQPKALIKTFGCQMNAHDSEKITGLLHDMGYADAGDEREADLIIFNTCCVRENAENRLYGNLGQLRPLKERNPHLTIVLCGCMMQQDAVIEKIKKTYRQADVIFGTYNLFHLPDLLLAHLETGKQIIDVWAEPGDWQEDLPQARALPFMASVNIMYGCDNHCTYCIVPHVRGPERSRPEAEILDEVKRQAAAGVREVLLLGQNVNSYQGRDGGFPGLLERVSRVGGLCRVRFMTSHPKDCSDELLRVMAENPVICRQLHLPIQSGSNAVLKRMNRRYSREDYLALLGRARAALPGVSVTTDIIVGFPGEMEEDFEDTLDIVRRVRFNGAYTFMYSKRLGTPAASMPEQVPERAASERFQRLLAVVNPILYENNQRLIGKVEPVLAETWDQGILTGRTGGGALVHFAGDAGGVGEILPVTITGCKSFYLQGVL